MIEKRFDNRCSSLNDPIESHFDNSCVYNGKQAETGLKIIDGSSDDRMLKANVLFVENYLPIY